MGRTRSRAVDGDQSVVGGLRAKAIFGTHTVVFAWDLPLAFERKGLAGFAIEKITGTHREWLLSGGRHFKKACGHDDMVELEAEFAGLKLEDLESKENSETLCAVVGATESETKPACSRMHTSYVAPIQSFSWCDYTCQPGEKYEYRIYPAYFSAGGSHQLDIQMEKGASLFVQMESNGKDQRHEVFFNRGVAGSQGYQRRFGDLSPHKAGPAAWSWLSNGLSEALLGYINRAKGPGWTLRGAFYEFTWEPALEAFKAAADRGVDVAVVIDCGPAAPREAKPSSVKGLPTEGRVDLKVPFQQKDDARRLGAKWDPSSKVWYAPNAERQLLEKWAPQTDRQVNDGPLKADVAIDKVAGLRKLVVRRELCKAISHNKFLVLISPNAQVMSVWTGSVNLTQSGIFGQANVAHIVNDRCVAEQYNAYWEQLAADAPTVELMKWNASQMSECVLPTPPEKLSPWTKENNSVYVVTCPRPSLRLLDCYAEFLASARSCACLTFAFTIDKTLGRVLEQDSSTLRYLLLEKRVKSHDSLLQVRANQVACGAVLGSEQLECAILEEGRECWRPENLTGLNEHVKFVHTKFMLVDPLGIAPMTISGSANFSQASVQKNDENMLFIIGDILVADLYFVEFWRLFQHWRFRDRVSQRMWDRRLASRVGNQPPHLMDLHLMGNDSWMLPFYDPSNAKCREREMLMSMFLPTDEGEVKDLLQDVPMPRPQILAPSDGHTDASHGFVTWPFYRSQCCNRRRTLA